MGFWQSLSGTMVIELTTADPAGALRTIEKEGIFAENLQIVDDFCLRLQICRRDYVKICAICKRRSDSVTVCKRYGIYWRLQALRKRPVLVAGILLLMAFSMWVPGRIFFVQVEGNTTVPSRQILEAAAKCGITFGATRRDVRSEVMKNALLEAMPQLSWAGVNTSGCTAVISVSERKVAQVSDQTAVVSSIVALRDGVIRELTVLRGNALCTTGQMVKAGDVLISGYTDCGICIRAACAAGEVYAETNRSLTAVTPAIFSNRGKIKETQKEYSLIIGKKRINFSNSSGISDTSCAKIYEEKYLTLPGGFLLPIALAVETWVSYEIVQVPPDSVEEALQTYCRAYLQQQMCAGAIESASESFTADDDLIWLDADYVCCEMIGLTRIEENLPNYGKND